MGAVSIGSTVLVTGASGFVGTHVVHALDQAGFLVRAAVRSEEKGKHVKALAPGIEVVVVPDMTAPGAYDAAAKDVDAIVNVASPVDITNPGDPSLVIDPAVRGVTGLLASMGESVKRVVHISDISAIANELHPKGVAAHHTEDEWNEEVVEICKKEGAAANPRYKYHASKLYSERAFWDYFKQPRAADGVALNLSLTFGPVIDYASSGGEIAGVASFLVPWMKPGAPATDLEREEWNAVDVRDVAMAVVRSLTTPQASGERFILAAHPLFMNDFALAAGRAMDNDPALTPGNPDPEYRGALEAKGVVFENDKAKRVLGLSFGEKDQTLADAALAVKATLAKAEEAGAKVESAREGARKAEVKTAGGGAPAAVQQ